MIIIGIEESLGSFNYIVSAPNYSLNKNEFIFEGWKTLYKHEFNLETKNGILNKKCVDSLIAGNEDNRGLVCDSEKYNKINEIFYYYSSKKMNWYITSEDFIETKDAGNLVMREYFNLPNNVYFKIIRKSGFGTGTRLVPQYYEIYTAVDIVETKVVRPVYKTVLKWTNNKGYNVESSEEGKAPYIKINSRFEGDGFKNLLGYIGFFDSVKWQKI